MRIIYFSAVVPRYHKLGADEQDQLAHLQSLVALGHQVRVVSMHNTYSPSEHAYSYYEKAGVDAHLVPSGIPRLHPTRLRHLAYMDGAGWEYGQPKVLKVAKEALQEFQPDLVIARPSMVWAPALLAQQLGFRTLVRSVNYEPAHEYRQSGNRWANRLREIGKQAGEKCALQAANLFVAISPSEASIYQNLAPTTQVTYFPLFNIHETLTPPQHAPPANPLNIFTMGSRYATIAHNRDGLRFLLQAVMPRLRSAAPNAFRLHVLGGKVPPELAQLAQDDDVALHGYVDDLPAFLKTMHIAAMPSLYGQGMQQKIFEALCRGFPTLTHARALAGYDFVPQTEVLLAEDAEAFVQALLSLRDDKRRTALGDAAYVKATALFAEANLQQQHATLLAQAARAK